MPWHKTDLLELVFEQVPPDTAVSIRGVLGVQPTPLPKVEHGFEDVAVQSIALNSAVVVRNPHVRVLTNSDQSYDVEVNFQFGDTTAPSDAELVAALYNFAADLAAAHGLSKYYAGLEPASDAGTRFFTGFAKGPLFISPEKSGV